MIHFDAEYLTVHWDTAVQCAVMEWKRYAVSGEFRTGLEKGLELVKQKRARKWLADMRHMGVVSPADQKWSNEDWFPRALAAGIHKMALIVPKSTLAQMSVDTIMSKVPGTDLETAYFDGVEKAKEWLRSA
jgi:hypothetical protein